MSDTDTHICTPVFIEAGEVVCFECGGGYIFTGTYNAEELQACRDELAAAGRSPDALVGRLQTLEAALDGLRLDGSAPLDFRVAEYTPEGHATRLFGVVADYGWAEQILFADAYDWAAEAICAVLRAALRKEGTPQ